MSYGEVQNSRYKRICPLGASLIFFLLYFIYMYVYVRDRQGEKEDEKEEEDGGEGVLKEKELQTFTGYCYIPG